jgi:hypothetical protein
MDFPIKLFAEPEQLLERIREFLEEIPAVKLTPVFKR